MLSGAALASRKPEEVYVTSSATDALDGILPVSPSGRSDARSFQVELFGRRVLVDLTRAAARARDRLTAPLQAQMELYFSCLVRTRLLFSPLEAPPDHRDDLVPLGDHLYLGFRPVATEHCQIADLGDAAPPLETMPVKHPAKFVPHWVRIDYRKGRWLGEFGFTHDS